MFADSGKDHGDMKENKAKGKISKWVNFTIKEQGVGNYWMTGKYGTHINEAGEMNFDMVTVVHAKKDVGMTPNWYYQAWSNY